MDPILLVVDADAQIRALARAVLQPEGYRILEAGDAVQAKRIISLESIHLALVDLGLPDGSGLDLIPALRATHPEARTIILSATGTIGSALAALNAGARDFLRKPFAPAALVAAVRDALDPVRAINPISAVRREFTRTNINGASFELLSADRDEEFGDVVCTFSVATRDEQGEPNPVREIRVVLPIFIQELAKALTDCDRLPCGARFWPRMAEEELANCLWQDGQAPESGEIRIEDIAPEMRDWLRGMTTAPLRGSVPLAAPVAGVA